MVTGGVTAVVTGGFTAVVTGGVTAVVTGGVTAVVTENTGWWLPPELPGITARVTGGQLVPELAGGATVRVMRELPTKGRARGGGDGKPGEGTMLRCCSYRS